VTVVKEREFAKRLRVQLSDFSTPKAFASPDDFGFARPKRDQQGADTFSCQRLATTNETNRG
jgi:hypothetical protein